ncbi:potassium transporter Trk [Halobacteriales archaeon QS_6_71_20]|nr:MAG: potassium transporter Trk [Halobacteriales archaeon QS_6_71_20]
MGMDLRVVVVGGHHVGYHAARKLTDRGHEVVIVEKDQRRVEYLSDQYIGTVIHGDGGRRSVLRQAGLDRSDVVAALTGYGAMTNVGICTMARDVAPGIDTVARIDHGDADEYTGMVDSVVYPEELAAHAATNEIVSVADGGVRTIEEVSADLELVDVMVDPGAPAAGKRLADVSFPRGSVVVADREGNQLPGPELVLNPGRRYVLAVHADVSDEVVRLLRG